MFLVLLLFAVPVRAEMVDEGITMTLYQSCEFLGRRSLHLTFLDRR